MSVPDKAEARGKADGKGAAPAQPRAKGMTPEERRLFEESFKRNEEALRRLAKL